MNLGHQAVSLADTHLLVCKEWTLFAFGTRRLRPLLCLSKGIDFLWFFLGGVAKVEICSGDDATKNSKNRSFMVKCGLYPRSLKFRYRFLRGKLLVCGECFILILKGFGRGGMVFSIQLHPGEPLKWWGFVLVALFAVEFGPGTLVLRRQQQGVWKQQQIDFGWTNSHHKTPSYPPRNLK